ncbi:MAG TPA: hypothetical protein VK144_10295 [Bacillota bacterium]|nr:hypothetical protein [Bacillota bacterium]
MKKYLFLSMALLMAALVLVACGSNEESNKEDNKVKENEEVADNESNEDNINVDFTTDPIEAVENDVEMFVDEFDYSYSIVDWYTNNDTVDGFNEVDFEGYKIKYAISLLMDEEGEDSLGVFAEVENGTEHELQFNDSFLFVTDTQDQTELEHGIQENKPNTKSKFFNHAPLEYGTPEELTVEIYPPFYEGESELIDLGEMVELEFTKE